MVRHDEIWAQVNGEIELTGCVAVNGSEVQDFYANKTLFITGATGYIGKCLLEKLLRSCPDLKHIYILLRQKKNASLDERLKSYFQNEIFEPLRKMNPDFEKKVTAMKGDLFLDNLGLSEEDQNILKKETNIIIHNGSNVKFNERVNVLLKTNILGTTAILDLAEECLNLDVFLYVSSAYSHCYRKIIKEEFYESPNDLSIVHKMIYADLQTEDGMSEKTIKLWIGDHFNVYTFTKSISENLVRQRSERTTFACGVFRPSMVTNSVKEPLPGWIGNANGPVLLFIMGGLGYVHTGYYNGEIFDLVPCDYSVNALLIVTRDLFNRWAIDKKPVVYNFGTSVENPKTLLDFDDLFNSYITPRERSSKAVWMNFTRTSSNYWLFIILHILFHFIPACIADTVLLLTGNKPQVLALFWRVTRNLDKLIYLSTGDWRIHMTETLKVIDSLNSIDKELFFCDLRQLNWPEYAVRCFIGFRKYILKEAINSDAGVRRYNLLWYAHYGLISALIVTFLYVFVRLIF